jgi:peroxiredoxin
MKKLTRPVRRPLALALACAVGAWLYAALGLGVYSPERPPPASPERAALDDEARSWFTRVKPALGEPAPDFTLPDTDGRPFHLAREVGKVPLVLELGSITCPLCLAGQSAAARELAEKYRDRATFVVVYCQEAHPEQDSQLPVRALVPGYEGLPPLPQTVGRQERAARARLFRQRAGVPGRVLVDEDGDRSVQRLYGANAHQNALFVIDVRGRVTFRWELAPLPEVDGFLGAHLSGEKPPRPRRYDPLRPLVPLG